MPGTKSSTVRRKKKRPPHLRKKMQLRRKMLPLTFVSPTVPATTSQPVTSIATSTPQPVPATTSQPVPATPGSASGCYYFTPSSAFSATVCYSTASANSSCHSSSVKSVSAFCLWVCHFIRYTETSPN